MKTTTGYQLIAAERQRQIQAEGWTPEHDDHHGSEVLELAASCYREAHDETAKLSSQWPWDEQWWKPKARQRNLERAGALYQAAADTAERSHDFQTRDSLLAHVNSCAVLLDSFISSKSS